jgi:hypothetical protein
MSTLKVNTIQPLSQTNALLVNGDARITGILTIGNVGGITFNGNTNSIGSTVTFSSSIGIRTTNPIQPFQVGTGSSIFVIDTQGNLGIGTAKPTQPFQVGTGSSIVVIDTQGDLGIGTTNARYKLEVGSVGASGTSLWVNGDTWIAGNARISGILTVGSLAGLAFTTLSGVNVSGLNTVTDGRALIYQNGQWIAGPVIGGYNYNTFVDPFYVNNVKLLLGMEGTNGSTTFTDSSLLKRTITRNGTGTISTAQSKFGSSSYYTGTTLSDSLSVSGIETFGSGDFTFECWWYPTQFTTGYKLFFNLDNGAGYSWNFTYTDDALSRKVFFYTYGGGVSYITGGTSGGNTTTLNQWNHLACTRSGTTLRIFINGSLFESGTLSTNIATGSLTIGPHYSNAGTTLGYLDEIRVSNFARYTSNFTPPTASFLTTTPTTLGYVINNLDDVDTSTVTPTNGQALAWNSSNSQWTPQTVGVGTTSNINTTGIITASKFVGDGSLLTNLPTGSGGIKVLDDNILVGTAGTIDFGSNISVSFSAGIATVNATSSLPSRTTVSGITTLIPSNGIGVTEISGFKTYGIMKVGLSTAAWIRLYIDDASRTSDLNRSINNDPSAGSGLVAEIATAGLSTVNITPFVIGFNNDDPITNKIYITMNNLSGISTNISFNITIVKMEA